MFNIQRILKDARTTSAIIGVTPEEFNHLLISFTENWQESKEEQHKKNAKKRKIGGGRKGFLKTLEEKLFFILLYFKCYPTYDVFAVLFDCNRSNACRRQFELASILEKALGRELVLPKRQIRSVKEFFEAFPEAKEIFIDGTERPIERSKNKEKQKGNYSGKKKRHTRKNLIISDEEKRVRFLSQTVNGKEHDFTILKKHAPPDCMPKRVKKHMDLGFQGFQAQFPMHSVSMPMRKRRNKPFTDTVKEQNAKKSSERVLIENVLAGVKRLRIVANVFRNKKENFDDQAMNIACGLWNYHLTERG